LVMAVFLVYYLFYIPLKFSYLIWRVESARTAAEEKQAFITAANWGRVWEVYLERTTNAQNNIQNPKVNVVVSLEWIECSPYNGAAYQTHRVVIDTNNLDILYNKKY